MSKTSTKSKVQLFVALVCGLQLLNNLTKKSILRITAAFHLPLELYIQIK